MNKRTVFKIVNYTILIFSISIFLSGFHSVDIAVHYFKSGTDNHWVEKDLLFKTYSIDDVYVGGIGEMFVGAVLFGGSMFYLGYLTKGDEN